MKIWIDRLLLVLCVMIASRAAPLQGANIVQNGGFETGNFSSWTLTGDLANTFVSFAFPLSGVYSALFGATNAPEFISQPLATSPGQAYTLSFWVMGSGDGGGGITNEFILKWGDTTLLDQVNPVIPDWTIMQFAVTANAAVTVLTFGGRNNQDYIYLDDVSVAIPETQSAPTFLSVTNASGLVQFSWSAAVGRAYQIQYRTDLAGDTWVDLGSPVTATNSTMAGSDSIAANPRRFYRVVLLP